MRLAIMQPYFLPYIGYFQLIAAADVFIVHDNIKYTKKGWINRNRMLQNGKAVTFSLPLKRDSDYLDIRQRELAADFSRDKLVNQIKGAYRHAPYFAETMPLVEQIIRHEETNLFHFLRHSIVRTCEHLRITTQIRISSGIAIAPELKHQDRVVALCEAVGARTYVNSIGGTELYAKESFREKGIDLQFVRSKPFAYAQFGNAFIPWLSIIDVMMFNSIDSVRSRIATGYELV